MDRPLFRLLKTWVQTKSPSLTTLIGLIWISSPGWLLTYLQQLSQSYALSLAPRCLLANELWRCLVITAAVSPFLSPPFYHLLNWRKIIDWNPLDIVWTLLSVISLVLVLFLAFGACSLMPTCPPPPLIFSQWLPDKAFAKDAMHLFEVRPVLCVLAGDARGEKNG